MIATLVAKFCSEIFIYKKYGISVARQLCRCPFAVHAHTGFVGASLILPSLFYIIPLSGISWVVTAALIAIMWLCLAVLTKLSGALFSDDNGKDISVPEKAKKAIIAVVFALSAVFAVWFGTLLVDYFSMSSGGEPIVAGQQTDGSYEGILYSIEGGEITVFGHSVDPIVNQASENTDA